MDIFGTAIEGLKALGALMLVVGTISTLASVYEVIDQWQGAAEAVPTPQLWGDVPHLPDALRPVSPD